MQLPFFLLNILSVVDPNTKDGIISMAGNSTLNFWGSWSSIAGLATGTVLTVLAIYWARKASKNTDSRVTETQKLVVETEKLVEQITEISKNTTAAGITNVYENRTSTLLPFLREHSADGKMVIVGSSLKGVWNSLESNAASLFNWTDRLRNKNLKTKFLLTHPCFARFREMQEDTNKDKIKNEITVSLNNLSGSGLDMPNCVRFYRGTPTCFTVITPDVMLLNPYSYQRTAYQLFCLEVKRLTATPCFTSEDDFKRALRKEKLITEEQLNDSDWIRKLRAESDGYNYFEDTRPHIYGQFYWYHYLLPWFSNQAVTYEEYNEFCINCPHFSNGFSSGNCNIDKARNQCRHGDV